MNSDLSVSPKPIDSYYYPSNLGSIVAENVLEDACPPKESTPRKDDARLKLPSLLDSDLDRNPSPLNFVTLCPDAAHPTPLCCSGSFDGKNVGLCVPCMFIVAIGFNPIQNKMNHKRQMIQC